MRRASLDEDGPTLRRARGIQRPAHTKRWADVIDRVGALTGRTSCGRPGRTARRRPPRCPTAPSRLRRTQPRARNALHHPAASRRILWRRGVRSGHDVPPGSPPADVVERSKRTRQVIGLAEGRGRCTDQANVLGTTRQRSEQCDRLEAGVPARRPPARRPRCPLRTASAVGRVRQLARSRRTSPGLATARGWRSGVARLPSDGRAS